MALEALQQENEVLTGTGSNLDVNGASTKSVDGESMMRSTESTKDVTGESAGMLTESQQL